jgi:hypothetical protein
MPSDSLRLIAPMAHTLTARLGPAARPVAVPEDVDDPMLAKANGVVELPLHIQWSGPPIAYDLNDAVDRARVYEQVLREGTTTSATTSTRSSSVSSSTNSTCRHPVRRAWAEWLQRHPRAA